MTKVHAAWVIVLGGVALVLLVSLPTRFQARPTFFSPHENVRWVLAGRWVDTGRPVMPLARFGDLPKDIAPALVPRDAALLDGTVVPKDFPYAVALVAMLRWVFPSGALFVAAASGLLAVIIVAALARELGAKPGFAIAGAAVFATTSAFWAGSSGLLETGATTGVFVLLTFWMVARRVQRPAESPMWVDALAAASAGVAIGLHHAAALVVIPVLSLLVVPSLGATPRRIGAAVLAGALSVAPILLFNAWMYGSALETGYDEAASSLQEAVGANSANVAPNRFDLLFHHVRMYWLRPEMLAVLALVAAGAVIAWRKRRPLRYFLVAMAAGAIPFLAFMGARPLSGSRFFETNGSWVRYGFGLYGAGAAFAALAIALAFSSPRGRGARRRALRAITIVAIGVGFFTNLFGGQGYLQAATRMPTRSNTRSAVLAAVPKDALVVTAGGDKYLWPERSTVIVAFLVDPNDTANDRRHVQLAAPDPARLVDVTSRLVAVQSPLYLWNDNNWIEDRSHMSLYRLDRMLADRGIQRFATGVRNLYTLHVSTHAGG